MRKEDWKMRKNKTSFMPKFILLCIVTTSIVTTFSFSKYYTTLTSSTNTSRVSIPVLNVEVTDSQESLTIDCNTASSSVNYEIIVSNKEDNIISEVSLKYYIEISFPTEVPSGLTVKIDEEYAIQSGNTFIIKNIGIFSPGKINENTHIVTFEADPDIVRSDVFEDITIVVYAEQID